MGEMAKKIFFQLVDDLDGRVLADGEGETVRFGLDGTRYEIDLSHEHAAELRSLLAPYRSAGRVAPRVAKNVERARAGGPRDVTAVRRWARANGVEVADRGRIPKTVISAFETAQR